MPRVPDSTASEKTTTARREATGEIFASESSFRAFYEAALPRIYGYVYSRCGGDAAVAEELTQQAFVSAIRARHRFEGRADAVTWLTAIARHKLADHFRGLDRDERRGVRLVERMVLDPEPQAWSRLDQRDAVMSVLATMPALQRAVLILHYADGLSIREVARQLGKSESAIESLMTRAREAFRRAYGKVLDV
jgi:RNA polymerase sigma-70 factor, ECF subfamily